MMKTKLTYLPAGPSATAYPSIPFVSSSATLRPTGEDTLSARVPPKSGGPRDALGLTQRAVALLPNLAPSVAAMVSRLRPLRYAAAAALIGVPSAGAQVLYTATDLGAGLTPTALNDSGEVVGSTAASNGSSQIFSYSNGQLTKQSIPGISGYIQASGINNLGVKVGDGYVNANTYAQPYVTFIENNGATTIVSNSGGTTSAQAINDHGVVTGGFALNYGNYFWDPFTYSNGTFKDLGAFGPSWVTYALAINNSGQIVGYNSNAGSNQGTHAFSYLNGVYTSLGALPGGNASSANAINNAGVIAGYSGVANGNVHAFSYSLGTMTDLGTLGGANSVAKGINLAGQIVGQSSIAGGANAGFVEIDGKMINLNSVLGSPLSTEIVDAVAINSGGMIAAEGANGDAYLLTPTSVPEPKTTAALFAGALLSFGLLRRSNLS